MGPGPFSGNDGHDILQRVAAEQRRSEEQGPETEDAVSPSEPPFDQGRQSFSNSISRAEECGPNATQVPLAIVMPNDVIGSSTSENIEQHYQGEAERLRAENEILRRKVDFDTQIEVIQQMREELERTKQELAAAKMNVERLEDGPKRAQHRKNASSSSRVSAGGHSHRRSESIKPLRSLSRPPPTSPLKSVPPTQPKTEPGSSQASRDLSLAPARLLHDRTSTRKPSIDKQRAAFMTTLQGVLIKILLVRCGLAISHEETAKAERLMDEAKEIRHRSRNFGVDLMTEECMGTVQEKLAHLQKHHERKPSGEASKLEEPMQTLPKGHRRGSLNRSTMAGRELIPPTSSVSTFKHNSSSFTNRIGPLGERRKPGPCALLLSNTDQKPSALSPVVEVNTATPRKLPAGKSMREALGSPLPALLSSRVSGPVGITGSWEPKPPSEPQPQPLRAEAPLNRSNPRDPRNPSPTPRKQSHPVSHDDQYRQSFQFPSQAQTLRPSLVGIYDEVSAIPIAGSFVALPRTPVPWNTTWQDPEAISVPGPTQLIQDITEPRAEGDSLADEQHKSLDEYTLSPAYQGRSLSQDLASFDDDDEETPTTAYPTPGFKTAPLPPTAATPPQTPARFLPPPLTPIGVPMTISDMPMTAVGVSSFDHAKLDSEVRDQAQLTDRVLLDRPVDGGRDSSVDDEEGRPNTAPVRVNRFER